VEGLADEHRVDAAVGHRQRLGGAVAHLDVGQHARELGPHAGARLDGDHGARELVQDARELAGARGEVDDRAARPEAEALREARYRVRRIGRARALVGLRRGAERRGRARVDRQLGGAGIGCAARLDAAGEGFSVQFTTSADRGIAPPYPRPGVTRTR
jgi:hypothetical protein